jgi:hypothetical protein
MQNHEKIRNTWQQFGINHTHCVGCDNIWKISERSTCECADLIEHYKKE